MPEAARQSAQRRLEQTRRVQALIEVLRALLDGRRTRAEAAAWTREQPPSHPGALGRLDSPVAARVFDALVWIDGRVETSNADLLREVDLRAYLDALTVGECFVGDRDALVGVAMDIETLAEQVGVPAVRWWWNGLGWFRELRFTALASGRPFAALAGEDERRVVAVHKLAADPWQDAVIDLFETLAIDDSDTTWLNPEVDLAALPTWALWRVDDNANEFEIARFRSYAKAERQERILRERGHRQFYWVDPV